MSLIIKNSAVFECSGLLIAVSLFSYHVRELLICWLFFSVPFLLLALLLLGAVFACNAGQYFVHWAGARILVQPVTVLGADKVQLETLSSARKSL